MSFNLQKGQIQYLQGTLNNEFTIQRSTNAVDNNCTATGNTLTCALQNSFIACFQTPGTFESYISSLTLTIANSNCQSFQITGSANYSYYSFASTLKTGIASLSVSPNALSSTVPITVFGADIIVTLKGFGYNTNTNTFSFSIYATFDTNEVLVSSGVNVVQGCGGSATSNATDTGTGTGATDTGTGSTTSSSSSSSSSSSTGTTKSDSTHLFVAFVVLMISFVI